MSLLILVVAILALMPSNITPNYRYRRHINRWRRALALQKHTPIFNKLYANTNGFALSRRARITNDAMEYTYGEIEFESFIALLSLCQPTIDTVFYDLGSGIGKAVIACAMVFDVHACYGIELFASLHHCALQQQQRLATITGYHRKATAIQFIANNFLNVSLHKGTLVFINSTAFFGELWQKISLHLEQLPIGALVISTSKPVDSKYFILKKTTTVAMSWGVVDAFIQQRITTNHSQENVGIVN